MSSPIGAAMRSSAASSTPSASSRSRRLAWALREPMAPMYPAFDRSASTSAASSSFGSCVSTAIAVAGSAPPSRSNASSGHAATTSSASGNRSAYAKRARGSTTNGRQPLTRATRHSAAAMSTAPNAISRGGGKTTSKNRSATPLGPLRPHQLVRARHRRVVPQLVAERADPRPVRADQQLRPARQVGHERPAAAVARERRERALRRHGSKRSTYTSISLPHGSPTSHASASAMPKCSSAARRPPAPRARSRRPRPRRSRRTRRPRSRRAR